MGTGSIATRDRVFKPFKEARAFVHTLGLNGWKGWVDYCRSGNRPDDIPASPNTKYKKDGWKNFDDWLGTETVAKLSWRPFKEARAFVHELNLKSSTEWVEYSKSGNRPDDIPASPDKTYKNKGWKNWYYWLGNE